MGEEKVAGFPYILTGLCCEGAVLKFSMDKCLLAIWGDWLVATAWVHGLGQWTWRDVCLVLRLPPAPSPPLLPITGALRNAPVPSKAHMIWEPWALSRIFQILAQRVEVREVHTNLTSCSILSPFFSPQFLGLEKAGSPLPLVTSWVLGWVFSKA